MHPLFSNLRRDSRFLFICGYISHTPKPPQNTIVHLQMLLVEIFLSSQALMLMKIFLPPHMCSQTPIHLPPHHHPLPWSHDPYPHFGAPHLHHLLLQWDFPPQLLNWIFQISICTLCIFLVAETTLDLSRAGGFLLSRSPSWVWVVAVHPSPKLCS